MINIGVCDDESVHRNKIKEILLDILKTFNLEYKIMISKGNATWFSPLSLLS